MATKTSSSQLALGMIETRGLVAAIEAADAMVKAGNVNIVSQTKAGGGLITILVRGEVGSVKAAIDAGAVAANKVGELNAVHIIPKPDAEIETLINNLTGSEN